MVKIICFYNDLKGIRRIWRKGIDHLCWICAHLENTQISKQEKKQVLIRFCRKEPNIIISGRFKCSNYITKSGCWKYDKLH